MYNQTIAKPITLRRFTGSWIVTFIVLVGGLSAAEAAEWRFEPLIRVAGDFNDNPILSIRTDVDEDISGYIVEGSAKIAYASDTIDFFVRPILRNSVYGSDTDFDTDDQFLRLNFDRKTQSANFRIRGNYSRESVRTAERADTDLEIDDPDEIPEDDSGRVGVRGGREKMQVVPYFLYRMSDVSAVSVALDYTDVRYDDVFAGLLTDYTDTRINASYRRALSQRNTAILAATYRNYQTDQGNNELAGIGLNVGLDRALSQTTRFQAIAGIEDTEVSDIESDLNWVANISLFRRLKTTSLLAQYRRSISASGSDSLATRDSINLNFTRQLSDRISAGLGARVYATNRLDESVVTFDERSYVQLLSQFTWHISPVFSLQANYRYSFLDREELEESSNSNQITVWLSYRPTPMVRSR